MGFLNDLFAPLHCTPSTLAKFTTRRRAVVAQGEAHTVKNVVSMLSFLIICITLGLLDFKTL